MKTKLLCRVTGKLIPKERLMAVPHATLSIEGKICKDKFVLCTTYNVQCIMCFEKIHCTLLHFIFYTINYGTFFSSAYCSHFIFL